MDIEQEHTIDFNFAAQYERQKDAIERRELATLPEKHHHKVLPRPRAELANRVQKYIRDWRNDLIPAALADFATRLRAAVQHEIATNPDLRPWSAEEQIKIWSNRLADLHWNGYELSMLKRMLLAVGGEAIVEGTLRYVRTDRRTISRDDLRAFADGLRPRDRPDQRAFDANFSSESAITAAERAAALDAEKRANPVFTSGPSSWVSSGKAIPAEQR
ncbi:MAG: hypothetical protein ACYDC3_10295 [Candidatus Binataceae bacterium]